MVGEGQGHRFFGFQKETEPLKVMADRAAFSPSPHRAALDQRRGLEGISVLRSCSVQSALRFGDVGFGTEGTVQPGLELGNGNEGWGLRGTAEEAGGNGGVTKERC